MFFQRFKSPAPSEARVPACYLGGSDSGQNAKSTGAFSGYENLLFIVLSVIGSFIIKYLARL